VAEGDQEDRTEAPTSRRLEKAREDGDIAQSRELQLVAGLAGGVLALFMGAIHLARGFTHDMGGILEHAGSVDLDLQTVEQLFVVGMRPGLMVMLVVGGGALSCGLAAGAAQTGFLIRVANLTPKFDKLDPRNGLKRVFGLDGVIEGARSVLKLGIFIVVGYLVLRQGYRVIAMRDTLDVGTQLSLITSLMLRACCLMIGLQVMLAALDVVWVRWRRLSKLRMSRQDLKDEHRQSEGDPFVKGRLRQLRMRAARRRMMEAVPRATVVVTNPTHYAVALVYEKGSGVAPKIVAKGADEVAWRIRQMAREHRIPIIPNPPLARALFTLPLDSEIPREHFRVVAGIIAFVMRLRRNGDAPGTRL